MVTPISSIRISAAEYRARRARFGERIGERAIAIIPAARTRVRNADVHYTLRQDSDFRYLCHFPEADALLVIAPGRASGACVLFCHERNAGVELWEGTRLGIEGAPAYSDVDEALSLSAVDKLLPQMLAGRDTVYCPADSNEWLNGKLRSWMRQLRQGARSGVRTPKSVVNLSSTVHEMRLVKSAGEIDIMREAGVISMGAHARAMAECAPGGWEYEMEAALHYEFMRHGARHWAYPPIVGSGDNTCVLHYTANNAKLKKGAMVLIDAGCELAGYASDISRSFPVDGRFSTEQAALFDVVCKAQQAAIACARPGQRFDDMHRAATEVLVSGMVDLGLLKGKTASLLRGREWTRFYPHRTGHWLGLDVHDVGAYTEEDGSSRLLQAGMVMTVEPGLYVQPTDQTVKPCWRGLGVRVEDDILITERGAELLNPDVLRTRSEVEAQVGSTITAVGAT